MRLFISFCSLLCALFLPPAIPGAAAKVSKITVTQVEPVFGGHAFGKVGAYEKVLADVVMEVDPRDVHNEGVVDLSLAPRNAAGNVEFSSKLYMLRPVDAAKGNGRLFYDVLNRGRKLGVSMMLDSRLNNEPKDLADAGNGFLMAQGYTIVWSGWQGDIVPQNGLMGLEVPGVPGITGKNRGEFILDNDKTPAVVTLSYPAADLDPSHARLTVRAQETDTRVTPADLSFSFVSPTKIEIRRPAGFDAGAIYEFVYEAKDAKVMGLSFPSVRDIVSFLRYGVQAPNGGENPLLVSGKPYVQHAYALGVSQSGRFLRDMLYQGFNEDEAQRKVFDGLLVHVAGARRTFVNYRFAQPGRFTREHEDHLYPQDSFPFSYTFTKDTLSGKADGLLKVCQASASGCPKVMQSDTDTEVMQARISLLTTDTAGKNLPLPKNVRAYLFSGAPHFAFAGGASKPQTKCQLPSNPLAVGSVERALLVAMDAWVSKGVEPPASRYPNMANQSLIAPEALDFSGIPGANYKARINRKALTDYTRVPPLPGKPYPVFVAKIDADGHTTDAVRLPEIEAPVATYMGWNPRAKGYAEGALCGTTGGMIPLARTKAEREAAGDRRLSIAERYPDHAAYVRQVEKAARSLEKQRLMLPEDVARTVAEAQASAVAR